MKDKKYLECEMCGLEWIDNLADALNDRREEYESIKQTKKCISCQEEFGNGCADRAF